MKRPSLIHTIIWLALGLNACSSEDAPLTDADAESESENPLEPEPPAPQLRWRSCGESAGRDLFCAELDVPLDYDAPDGETLPIAMNRLLANPAEPHRGVLLFNPGGPGASGKETALGLHAAGVFDAIAPGFDVIGFDPRGVGESGSRSCGLQPEPAVAPSDMASEMAGAPVPGMQVVVDSFAAEGARCERNWGPIFRELGSKQVVRDMDAMRQALGQDTLDYLGISYGTRLGALYAHTFPESTGRIVLDAPVHPQLPFLEDMRIEFRQTLALHERLFVDCESGALTCPAEPRRLFEEMIESAAVLGIDQEVLQVWRDALADAAYRQVIPVILNLQATEQDPEWLYDVAELASSSGVAYVVNFSVNCTDASTEPASVQELDALYAEFMAESPYFASLAMSAAACTGWPVTRDPVPVPVATDAPPLLVIGGVADLRTPFAYAEAMTAALGNATLLTSNHYGHGATPLGNECVNAAVRSFLTDGALPAYGSECF